jgi:hypothetical protein
MKGKISLVDAFAVATVLWEHFHKGATTCLVKMRYGFGEGQADINDNPLCPDSEEVSISMLHGPNGEEKIRIISKYIGSMEICMLNAIVLWVRDNEFTAYKHSEKKNDLMAVAHSVLNRLIFEGIWGPITDK